MIEIDVDEDKHYIVGLANCTSEIYSITCYYIILMKVHLTSFQFISVFIFFVFIYFFFFFFGGVVMQLIL